MDSAQTIRLYGWLAAVLWGVSFSLLMFVLNGIRTRTNNTDRRVASIDKALASFKGTITERCHRHDENVDELKEAQREHREKLHALEVKLAG